MPAEKKHPDLRARVNVPTSARGPELAAFPQPALPEMLAEIGAVSQWWAALGRDPRSAFMTELDWIDATDTAIVLADFHENLNVPVESAVMRRKDRLEKRLRELGELAALKEKREAVADRSASSTVKSARERLRAV